MFDGLFSGRLLFSSCGYKMTDMITKDVSICFVCILCLHWDRRILWPLSSY